VYESQDNWVRVDEYFQGLLVNEDAALRAALTANADAGLPPGDVAPNQGKLLQLFARMSAAKRILEIGTLGGYSTIWLARALPDDGVLVSLDVSAERIAVAHANLERAGVATKVDLRVGLAVDSLSQLIEAMVEPFDLVFIDADKRNSSRYLELVLQLTRPGSVIVGDNVVRNGHVTDEQGSDPNVVGTRSFLSMIASHPRLDATALQTVGSKGWDGFVVAFVN
jgi:predicted O-methyltransferase YrrM